MKAALIGFGKQRGRYADVLLRCGCSAVDVDYVPEHAQVVLLSEVQELDKVLPHIQSLKHVFIKQHSLSSKDLQQIDKVASEAEVVVHFSAPKLYEWNIPDVIRLIGNVKLIQVYKDYDYAKKLHSSELKNELLAAACVVSSRISNIVKSRSIVPCDFEVLGFRIDFANVATAHFWLGSSTFTPRQEVRFFGCNGMVLLDDIARAVHLKTLDGTLFTTPFLSPADSEEKELMDFIQSIARGRKQTLLSAVNAAIAKIAEERLSQLNK
ncbi:MAG: hypothetical protein LBK47_05070 [Prevotellaceae bacterium]|jgi:hypothetical protein|nr:hypothetical protein [Prevotellaceae bacterium]